MYNTELRNRLYSVIVAEEKARETKLFYLRRDRSQDSKSSLVDRHPSRQYLGFTQTNRLLRAEFLPLYRAAHRSVIDISEVAEYLEVFPLPDSAANDSITTTLTSLRRIHSTKAVKSPGIDLLPLLRAKWNTFPFIVSSQMATWPYVATYEIPHRLLRKCYDNPAAYDELWMWERGITAVYFDRRPSMFVGLMEVVITLDLSAELDADRKIYLFQLFVGRTQICRTRFRRIEYINGRLKMVAEAGMPTVIEHLGDATRA